MSAVIGRTPFPVPAHGPVRVRKRTSTKMIFLAMEGSVTEEEYFNYIKDIFSDVQSKIRLLSVVGDIVDVKPTKRTPEQEKYLSMCRPKQLVERLNDFRKTQESTYEFSKHGDEFWIVTDVDNNWEPPLIDDWNAAISDCHAQHYDYAISNPFFEVWLLLHYDDPTDDDKAYAVTTTHNYEPTNHFKDRLRALNVPLKGNKKKHLRRENFDKKRVIDAVRRAKALHIDKSDLMPHYLSSTVYRLIDKILELLPEQPETSSTATWEANIPVHFSRRN